jgi:hypothetical protein
LDLSAKFSQDSATLDEAAAADLARQMLAAAQRQAGPSSEGRAPEYRTRLLCDPESAPGVGQARWLVYPEHVAIAVIWLAAVVVGLWRLLA